ncbi:MAG: hypothetical protein SFW08_13460 [Gemmatimonadaceae bacterium]|nr:hypothetical protein [Gemmatimonadaceae bacterium]
MTGRTLLRILVGLVLVSCADATGPDIAPPYVVVLPRVTAVPNAVLPPRIWYRIRKLSSPQDYDVTVTGGPRDTIRFSKLDIATYEVTANGWPERCRVTDDADRQQVIVFAPNTTSLVRLRVLCEPSLQVTASVEGVPPTDSVIFRLVHPDGRLEIRKGRIGDRTIVDGLPAGTYRVGYGLLPPNCVPLTPGGALTVPITVTNAGGSIISVRYQCIPPNISPRILSFRPTYADGYIGFTLRAVDANRNLDRVAFGVTDCAGRWVGQTSERIRNGFLNPFGVSEDTSQATIAIPSPVASDSVTRFCVAARVIDRDGNSSPVREQRIEPSSAFAAPIVDAANAVFLSRFEMSIRVTAHDVDGDLAGVYALLTLRDGTLNGTFDGQPDIAAMNSIGYRGLTFPILPVGNGRPDIEAYVDVVMFVFDRAGNITVIRDRNLYA